MTMTGRGGGPGPRGPPCDMVRVAAPLHCTGLGQRTPGPAAKDPEAWGCEGYSPYFPELRPPGEGEREGWGERERWTRGWPGTWGPRDPPDLHPY